MAANFASAGSTRNINHGSASSLDSIGDTFEAAFWLKRTANGYATGLIATKDTGSAGWGVYVQNSGGEGQVVFYRRRSVSPASCASAIGRLALNANILLFVSYNSSDSQVCRIFWASRTNLAIEEASYASSSNGSGTSTNDAAADLVIGGGGTTPFPGEISRVALYNRVLSMGERRALSQFGSGEMSSWVLGGSTTTKLAVDYVDNGSSGVAATDVSGNSNTGTVTGATLATHAPLPTKQAVTDADLQFSPYNWDSDGTGDPASNQIRAASTYALASCVGAKFRFTVDVIAGTGSGVIGAIFDTSSLSGLSAADCPVVGVSIDGATPVRTQLAYTTSGLFGIELATLLSDAGTGIHKVEVSVEALGYGSTTDQFSTPANAAKLLGVYLEPSLADLTTNTVRPGRVLVYGDSASLGYAVLGAGTGQANHAFYLAWVNYLEQAFNAEVGFVGYSGCGYARGIGNVAAASGTPSLYNGTDANQFWNKYRAGRSRLSGGLLTPQPDVIVVSLGHNDSVVPLTGTIVTNALTALRGAAPLADILVCDEQIADIPELTSGIAGMAAADRNRVTRVTHTPVIATGATKYTFDNLHPNAIAHAVRAAEVVAARRPERVSTLTGGGLAR